MVESTNFIKNIILNDKKSNTNLIIQTRFPPEPNGHLHFGHAKSIFLNFGLAELFKGNCNLRFDDTNPTTENITYVNSIIDSLNWLGFKAKPLYASDYFDLLHEYALIFIKNNLAYVDSNPYEKIKELRGTLTKGGIKSQYRERTIEENLKLFDEMKNGVHKEGTHVLRLKIDMSSPNINMRDPVIYRIKKTKHHRTKDNWKIFPMYDYTHCISDAIENINYSLCTLEFEDHRPLYDWILEKLKLFKIFKTLPRQIEFSRLNLTHVLLSKRKLLHLVESKKVNGWDDPRMPTLIGAKRRGYPPESFKLFMDRIGISKSDSWIDFSTFEDCVREILDSSAHRRFVIFDPIEVIIENFSDDQEELCHAKNHPKKEDFGKRDMILTKRIYIDKQDFMINPPKNFFRLKPGGRVRLRNGFTIECTSFELNDSSEVKTIKCKYFADSKSGTEGFSKYKVKGNIHWVSKKYNQKVVVNLYDRLFISEQPGTTDKDFVEELNPNSLKQITCFAEKNIYDNTISTYQFERHGFFHIDDDSSEENLIFNRTVTLKDSWKKGI